MLDFPHHISDTLHMDFPTLREMLADYFGEDSDITSPDDETEAWQSIVRDCRDGLYPGLRREVQILLQRPDDVLLTTLHTYAPAWPCETGADARRAFEVFYAYLETHSV